MNSKCLIENHSNKSIITICLASQCKGKRVCCSKCQAEFHKDHQIDQFVAFNDLLDFIKTQSQKPNAPPPNVMQELLELNNILKDLDDLTKLIRQEIQRLSQANLQTFCKDLGNHYKIFTEQIGNQQWNDLAQEMLSHVELKEGEIVEKDSLITHLGKPYSHFMKDFSLALTKMIKELKIVDQIIDPNQSVIDPKQKVIVQSQDVIDQKQNKNDKNDTAIDPNPFSKLTECHVLKGHTDTIYAIDICEQRNLLVSGSNDSSVQLWNLQDNTLLKTYEASVVVYDVVFSANGSLLAYGGTQNIIYLIEIKDLTKNNTITELKGHSWSISRLTFSNDQVYLISGSYDETVRVWNVETKQELYKLETGYIVFGLVMNRDNSLIVSHSQTTGIMIWDFKSQICLCTHKGHHPYGLGIIFSNDEKQLISSGSDGEIKIWSLSELPQGKLSLIKEFKVANNRIQKVLLTSDSRFILLYCYEDLKVKVIDSNTGEEVKQFKIKNLNQASCYYQVGGVAITKQMTMLAYGNDKEIVVWKSNDQYQYIYKD